MSEATKKESCDCFIARHPKAGDLGAALLEPEADVVVLAARYRVSKTMLYEHRKHLRAAGLLSTEKPKRVSARSVRGSAGTTEKGEGFHGKATEPRKTEESPARAQPQVPETTRGIAIPPVHGTAYLSAVEHCAEAITRGVMRPAVLQGIAQKLGITRDRARQALYEAARHLRMDMGGMLERQEASIAWTLRQRDEAKAKAEAREKAAEDWRQKERRAHEDAQGITDPEARINALGEAARMGLVASKYGLEAEKWHASALAHQRHLDDIQCLLGPKELHLHPPPGDGEAMLERLGAELARRFAGQADALRLIEAAMQAAERRSGEVIETTGEAA
jgi:hypothetical protein